MTESSVTIRIPLNLSEPEPNEDSLTSIREADDIIASSNTSGYSSAAEMFQAMGLEH